MPVIDALVIAFQTQKDRIVEVVLDAENPVRRFLRRQEFPLTLLDPDLVDSLTYPVESQATTQRSSFAQIVDEVDTWTDELVVGVGCRVVAQAGFNGQRSKDAKSIGDVQPDPV